MPDNADTRITPEKAQENVEKAIADLEKGDNKDEQEESAQDESQKDEGDKGENADDADSKEDEQDDNDEEEAAEDDELERVKKERTESTREAQILAAKNKQKNEAIDKAAQITDVTEEELKKEFPNYDDMDDATRMLAKKQLISDKRWAIINEARNAEKDVEAWNTKVDEFVGDPKTLNKHKQLEGKLEDFKVFATKKSRRGTDFETLIDAFLFNNQKLNAEKKLANKGSMLPTGGSGDKKSKGSGKLSLAEGAALRDSNYNEYRKQLMAGNIEEM